MRFARRMSSVHRSYATTEGFPPLREKIAERYAARGTRVRPEEVLVLVIRTQAAAPASG